MSFGRAIKKYKQMLNMNKDMANDTEGKAIVSMIISLLFVVYLVPIGLREVANANLTGVGATEASLFGLISLFVILGILKGYASDAE